MVELKCGISIVVNCLLDSFGSKKKSTQIDQHLVALPVWHGQQLRCGSFGRHTFTFCHSFALAKALPRMGLGQERLSKELPRKAICRNHQKIIHSILRVGHWEVNGTFNL